MKRLRFFRGLVVAITVGLALVTWHQVSTPVVKAEACTNLCRVGPTLCEGCDGSTPCLITCDPGYPLCGPGHEC